MAKSLGTLVAGLVLDTSRWGPNFAKAGKQTQQFVGTTGLANRALAGISTSMMGVAAGALSVGSAVSFMRSRFTEIDRQAKLADRLGITMEATQKLGHAADLSGTNLEMLAKAMLMMNRNIGSGGLSLDKRFLEQADALAKIHDPAIRASEAFRIFGRSGVEVLNLLAQGGDSIFSSTKRLEDLGLFLSRADAAKVEAANDALTETWAVLRGIGNTLAVEASPGVKKFADQYMKSFENLRALTKGLGVDLDEFKDRAEDALLKTLESPAQKWLGRARRGKELFSGGRDWLLKKAGIDLPPELNRFNTSVASPAPLATGGMEGGRQIRPPSVERHTLEAARLLQNIEGGNAMNTVSRNTWAMLRELQRVRENTDPARRPQRALVSL